MRWKGFGKAEDSWEKAGGLKDAKLAIDDFRQKAVSSLNITSIFRYSAQIFKFYDPSEKI